MEKHTHIPEIGNIPARPALVAYECIAALREIKAAIADDTLEDEACFARISEIIAQCERICGFEDA